MLGGSKQIRSGSDSYGLPTSRPLTVHYTQHTGVYSFCLSLTHSVFTCEHHHLFSSSLLPRHHCFHTFTRICLPQPKKIQETDGVFRYLSLSFIHSLFPLVTHVGEQEHPKSHVMATFLAASLGCPLFLLFCICHQAFSEGALMGAVLARDLSLHTHAHLACTCLNIHKHTQTPDTHIHIQRGIDSVGSVAGSWYDHRGCQPRAVV